MTRVWLRTRGLLLGLLALGLLEVSGLADRVALAQYTSSAKNPSWTDSISSSFKQGFTKIGSILSPSTPTKPASDALSLDGKGKPDANLYVQAARLYVGANKLADAEQQYQLALKDKPDYLPALLGYAQLEEQVEKSDEALRLYQRAVKAHPKEAAVYNNMGLYYARRKQLDEAVQAMGRAVQLAPRNALYHNNFATVLVEHGRLREAFEQLRSVHGEAVAHYNLGYLLNRKGRTQEALQHFDLALQADPSLVPARQWNHYLQQTTAQARAPRPVGTAVKVVSPPSRAQAPPVFSEPSIAPRNPFRASPESAPMPPNTALPQRLPPTGIREPAAVMDDSSMPSIPYGLSTIPLAPLPPTTASRSGLGPLPPVR